MRKITILIPETCYEKLLELVKKGEYTSISEAVRDILRRFLESD